MSSLRHLVITILFGVLLAGCAPRVATSFWRIGTPADSVRPGYAILTEGSKVRHCYPITEWTDSLSPITNHQSPMCATAHFYLTVCGATKENHPVATTAAEWLIYLRKWAKGLK